MRRRKSFTSHSSTLSPGAAARRAASMSVEADTVVRSSSTASRWAPRQAGLGAPYLRRMRPIKSAMG
jgi:hypothetical protein